MGRLAQLRAVLARVTGADGSLSGRFDRFHGREQVTMLAFDTRPGTPTTFDVSERDQRPVLDRIRLVRRAGVGLRRLWAESAADPDRITSVVTLSDCRRNWRRCRPRPGGWRSAFVAIRRYR
jgi:Ca-activated chloride channel homolog